MTGGDGQHDISHPQPRAAAAPRAPVQLFGHEKGGVSLGRSDEGIISTSAALKHG